MNCSEVQKQWDSLGEESENTKLNPELQEHLDECAACREQWHTVTDSIELLKKMPRITPKADFTAAWKNRLHQEVAPPSPFKAWWAGLNFPVLRPVLGAVMLVAVSLSVYTVFYTKPTVPRLAQQAVPLEKPETAVLKASRLAAVENGTSYELKIVEVGPKSKEVQKLIRNYRSSHEGGAALLLRKQENDWTVLNGLKLEQAKDLQKKLEQAGAKVEVVAE